MNSGQPASPITTHHEFQNMKTQLATATSEYHRFRLRPRDVDHFQLFRRLLTGTHAQLTRAIINALVDNNTHVNAIKRGKHMFFSHFQLRYAVDIIVSSCSAKTARGGVISWWIKNVRGLADPLLRKEKHKAALWEATFRDQELLFSSTWQTWFYSNMSTYLSHHLHVAKSGHPPHPHWAGHKW